MVQIPFTVKQLVSLISLIGLLAGATHAQLLDPGIPHLTRADTVRGTNSTYRTWWDVQHYNLDITPDIADKTLKGFNIITFKVLSNEQHRMQLDLQEPLQLDSVLYNGRRLPFERYEQAYLITWNTLPPVGSEAELYVFYHGKPKIATNPPWNGGLIWTKDDQGNPWVSVACQGLGASVWWPVKDHGSDEPDRGVTFTVTTPGLVDVSNGILIDEIVLNRLSVYTWEVKSPINTYNVTMNIGKYTHFTDEYQGLNGPLKLNFWFLAQHEATAKKHLLEETKEMLRTFEYWFGPYPFYYDGYKLIETPFLGMEHQSGIAYGNKFMKGYMGRDLSGSGWGLKWDYILVHESGHEWFGNNISTKDVADMWVHEGFTTYSEVLFVESRYGKKAADEYALGLRNNIGNDKPIIGIYNVNQEGSGDMYFKGVQMIHTYRQIVNDDVKFRAMLHEMNKRFGLKTTTTQEVEALMQEYTDVNLEGFFDTYLRTVKIPILELQVGKKDVKARFTNVTPSFTMPVNLYINGKTYRVGIGTQPVTVLEGERIKGEVTVDTRYYLTVK